MASKKARTIGKAQTLTVFLLRDGLTARRALRPGLKRVAVKNVGDLHVQQNPDAPPKWLTFFEDALTEDPGLHGASNGGVLTVKRGQRVFAVTFGQGRHLLQSGTWEESFGLRVTLNSVDPERLRSIDRKTFDAITSHTRTQATLEGDVTAFGLNIEQDMLRAATGSPLDLSLGTRMTGMDSLLVAVRTKLADLPALLDKYLAQFTDTTYKKRFAWVDNLAEIGTTAERDKLDAKLLDALRSPHPSQQSAWMAIPELIEWADVGGFRYRMSTSATRFDDLRVSDFMKTVKHPQALDIATLRGRHIFAFNTSDDRPIWRWSAYQCIYAEVEHNKTTHVLSGGKWYRIERNFVTSVNNDVAKLVAPTWLPKYNDVSEGAYNQRAAQSSGGNLALVDRKLVRIGGSSVEFCDLYAPKQIIHVKRYGASGVLSHLFSQGSISGDCFLEEADFRRRVNDILPSSHKLADPLPRPDPRDYEIVYAVISRSPKPVDRVLPFFSRLNLRNAARRLGNYGYVVRLTKVEHQ
jgi:uncharacterized protein (TIGR04141 family)